MQIKRKISPHQKGAKISLDQYGAKFICVRHRYDDQKRKRFKTIGPIIEESYWAPPGCVSGGAMAGVRVVFEEAELQRRVKRARSKWNLVKRGWEIHYDQAVAVIVKKRIVKLGVSDIRRHRVSNTRRPNVSSIGH